MSMLTQGKYAADFILSEDDAGLSRDNGTVAAGSGHVEPGTILAKVAGKFVPLTSPDPAADPAAPADPHTVPAAVLIPHAHAVTADVDVAVMARQAQLKSGYLVYPAGANAAVVAAINAGLAKLGLIVR